MSDRKHRKMPLETNDNLFECPHCGPYYYNVSIDQSRIEEGILTVTCECDDLDCDYKTEHVFKSEWYKS